MHNVHKKTHPGRNRQGRITYICGASKRFMKKRIPFQTIQYRYILIICLLLPSFQPIRAACLIPGPDTADYFNSNYLRYADYTYKPNIKSILLHQEGFELSDPVIQLNGNDHLNLGFDDLEGNIRQYLYTVIHCDASWHPSEIWFNDYIEGLQEDLIEDYQFSFNTLRAYTHYSLSFPNERLSLKLSGNYILKVYTRNNDGMEELAFTRRFLVFDPKVSLEANVIRATTIEEFETNQEIDFLIHTSGYRIDSPYQDIQVTILQNGRWDNALSTLKPYLIKGDVLDYSYTNGSNQFPGGNEFRRFDIRSLRTVSEKVKGISRTENGYDVNLWESERRTFKVYVQDDDINGKFTLKTYDESAVETMGDYALVHFFLPYAAPVVDGSLYVGGGFNGWQYTPENKMKFNYIRHGYEAEILLKQGYYNYQYILLPNNSGRGDATYVEGSHYQTGNNYTILVYQRERGTVYDQLIAVGNFDSRKTK